MNRKRFSVIMLLGLFIISFMSGLVVADDAVVVDATDAATNLKESTAWATAFFEALFSDTIIGDETLSRIFMAILLAMIVYTAIGSFFEGTSEWITWTATIAVTVIAMLGLPSEFLISIRTTYGAMGATILSLIPFLVIFWFSVKTKNLMMAKATWVFYAVYYFALVIPAVFTKELAQWPYVIALGLGIFMAFFIGWVRRVAFHGELASQIEAAKTRAEVSKARKEAAEESRKAEAGF